MEIAQAEEKLISQQGKQNSPVSCLRLLWLNKMVAIQCSFFYYKRRKKCCPFLFYSKGGQYVAIQHDVTPSFHCTSPAELMEFRNKSYLPIPDIELEKREVFNFSSSNYILTPEGLICVVANSLTASYTQTFTVRPVVLKRTILSAEKSAVYKMLFSASCLPPIISSRTDTRTMGGQKYKEQIILLTLRLTQNVV